MNRTRSAAMRLLSRRQLPANPHRRMRHRKGMIDISLADYFTTRLSVSGAIRRPHGRAKSFIGVRPLVTFSGNNFA